ncbi:DUF308 domain-containing protein [Cellulophaga sp. E16_2]|uniref:Membrane protein n=1 Tax=Cellulophaga algicola (strain DSM 14237 / IC166 / ACAM 630) TaxID=688270 RepID=E6XEG7_CELAD|nr:MULTISPECIES: DUF308 domain-containing protein [Cellulophaga]ADV50257.1 membrane protein [Cellulophaga algicola DSM 14237]MBO0592658.1 DUF308 domain-containing protein [Cellulophaga sp. E16_2]
MATQVYTSTEQSFHNPKFWWLQILLGIIFIFSALWFLDTPIETYLSLTFVFSFLMLFTGLLEVINALTIRNVSSKFSLKLTGAFIDLVFGVFLIGYEKVTLELLPVLLGIWLVFRSFQLFFFYSELKKRSRENKWWTLAAAIFTLLFAMAIIVHPFFGELTLIYAVSFSFFIMGLYRVTLGYKLYQEGD